MKRFFLAIAVMTGLTTAAIAADPPQPESDNRTTSDAAIVEEANRRFVTGNDNFCTLNTVERAEIKQAYINQGQTVPAILQANCNQGGRF